MSAIENIRRQISIQQRRLQILKEQRAKLGIYTPPNIIIDIEDTEAALGELQETLAELEKTGGKTEAAASPETCRAKIYLEGNFSAVSDEVKQAAINAFAAVMGISPQDVALFGISAGSIVFDMAIPRYAAERLQAQLQRNSAQLRLLKVHRVSITLPGGITQTWRYDDGQFRLSPKAPPKPSFFKRLLKFIRNVLIGGGIVVIIGWLAVQIFAPSDNTVDVPPPVKPTPSMRSQPSPKVTVNLPDGCNWRYPADTDTQIIVETNIAGEVFISLNGDEIFVMPVSPDEPAVQNWVIPARAGEYTLRATLDAGASADCAFSVYQPKTRQPRMTTEYDTNRPGMNIDNGFPALIDPDDTRGLEGYVDYCRAKCLENADCQAYTLLKEKRWCYLKFEAPPAVSDDCCVSGVKMLP